MNDLKLLSEDELLEEIYHRFDHMIFAGQRPSAPDDMRGQSNFRQLVFRGNFDTCIGLAERVKAAVLEVSRLEELNG